MNYLSKSTDRIPKRTNIFQDSAILSLNDFERIKKNAQFIAIESSVNKDKISSEQESTHQFKPDELKQRIKEYDRNKNASNLQTIDLSKYAALSNKAKQSMEKKEDCVKAMDKIIFYAKIATIRDRQVEERKRLEEIYKKKENRLEVMMELERLKEMAFQEEREKDLKRQQKAGSKIIIEQIKEAEIERLKKNEQLEKEKTLMMRQIQIMEEEDKRNAEYVKQRNERLYKESMAANNRAILEKEKRKIDEKELNLKIQKFTMLKDQRDDAMLKEKKRVQEEKEREVQKLREKQEKMLDKQADLDVVRAKRAYEANEQKARMKMEQERVIKENKIKELKIINEKQVKDQEMKHEEEARQEQLLFEKIIEKQNREIDEENRLKEELLKKRYENNNEIR